MSEQECQLTKTQVTDTYHLDDKPGYKVEDMAVRSCSDTLKLTFTQCEDAKASLDWNARAVTQVTNDRLPNGCFRMKAHGYRFQHNESSYEWFFNNAASGQADARSQPVCQGNARQR